MAQYDERKHVQDVALSQVGPSYWRSSLPQHPDLEQVFSQYVDPVYRFLYSRLGNREDAEDLTSEVFLKATRQLDPGRAEASIAQWLFTVARTVLADHWRRYYRTGAPLPLDESGLGDVSMPSSGGHTQSASAQLVSEVLSRLSDRYRQVLELRFLKGYTIQETAQEMGVTPENVKVLQHRALAKAVQVAEGKP